MARRRGLGIVIGVIVFAVVLSAAGVGLLYFAVSRQPGVSRNSTLVLRLEGDLRETSPDDVVRQFLEGDGPPSLRTIVDNLRKAKTDPRVGAVLIVPSGLQASLWGKVNEVRDAIVDFRRSGKPAIAYLEYGGDREYFIASACSQIFLQPTSPLDVNGLASYDLFLRGTLDKIDAYPDFLHIGPYKTAPNQFTERGYTPAHREVSEALNRDLFEQLVRAIADGRGKTEEDVRALIDQGPFLPGDAERAGLVDGLAYFDEIDDRLELPGGRLDPLSAGDYARVPLTSLGLNRGPRIAVIQASGVITSGRSGYDPIYGEVLGSDTFIEYLKEARDDRAVRAIVLRIDSPGGSAIASDAIWREIVVTRDQKPDRPIVVSMSDLAASGGYYMAMAAPWIVAQPGTLTGSIGIFSGKVVTGGTYAKAGANIESVSNGRFADMNSPARPYSDEERAKVEAYMRSFYDTFVSKAAESRQMPVGQLDAVAQGRVWTGRQAREVGLVDELGGLNTAIAAAKQRAKIGADQDVEVVVYPPRRSVYEILSRGFRTDQRALLADLLFGPEARRAIGTLAAPAAFRPGEPLALMPVGWSR